MDRRSTELSKVIRNTLEQTVALELLPRSQIDVYVQVRVRVCVCVSRVQDCHVEPQVPCLLWQTLAVFLGNAARHVRECEAGRLQFSWHQKRSDVVGLVGVTAALSLSDLCVKPHNACGWLP
jgi:hypothetical protein